MQGEQIAKKALLTLIVLFILVAWPNAGDIAAPRWDRSRALPFVLAAGSSLVLPDWYYQGLEVGGDLGWSVASAGDVDCDGFDDIIVGAPKDADRQGVAYVFYGSAAGLDEYPDWTVPSGEQGSAFGASVASAGDVNADGCDDVLVGAYEYKGTAEFKIGAVYVYLGGHGGLSTTPHRILEGPVKSGQFGYSVGSAGDVNKDTYDDVIVGARWLANVEATEGGAFVFLGSSTGLSTTPIWSAYGGQAGAGFGASVGTAGDVDGDGYDDVIIGAPFYNNVLADEGAVFVFRGLEGGLEPAASWVAYGGQLEAEFGTSVGTAGDVNHDSFADVVVGAPDFDGKGAAFAFHGSSTGLSTGYSWKVTGGQEGGRFGASVGTAGSLNGDEFSDVIVGSSLYTRDQRMEGAAFVFYGMATGLSLQVGWTAEGNKADSYFGYSVGRAGNVNSDAYDDVIVGAPEYKYNDYSRGRAFVFRGAEASYQYLLPWVMRAVSPESSVGD